MTFYPPSSPIPEFFQNENYLFRPLKTADNELDYDAVMASKYILRKISSSTWPEEGFSLADNYEDLYRHENDHNDRKEFTFTIIASDRSLCLGCLYIRPPPSFSHSEKTQATVRFWVRESTEAESFERRVLKDIIRWLEQSWQFITVYFQTGINASRQIELFKSIDLKMVGDSHIDGSSEFLYFQYDIESDSKIS